jgi:signal transduction histidine kinase
LANFELHRLEALYSASQSLGASLSIDEVLTRVMDAIILLTGAERGFLMLANDEAVGHNSEFADPAPLQLRIARSTSGEPLSSEDMEVSYTIIHTVLKSGKSVVTTNAQLDPRFANQVSITLFNLRGILCLPLRLQEKTMGVIYVDNRAQNGLFKVEDLSLLDAFAAQAAAAIENALLYTRTDQALAERVKELEILSEIDRELNTDLDLHRVLEITQQWAIRETKAQESWIALSFDQILRIITGPCSGETIDRKDTLVKRALSLMAPSEEGDLCRAVIPLKRAEKLLGILVVEKKEPFSNDEFQFLKRLGERASSTVENARLYRAVHDANYAKSKFVSVVSHELRIPMTSIKGYTDLLRQGAVGPVNEMQSNFLNVIHCNVDRMNALVSDLSDISRIETGQLQLNLEQVSIESILQESILTLQPRIEEKEQIVHMEITNGLPAVYADSSRLAQITNNLIGNASKYTPQAGTISVKVMQKVESVLVEVTDNGIGISEEDQAELFKQFFRSENEIVREQQGWGLGLNVTKRLIEMMGGEIGVISKLNEGSTFWFTIPIHKGGSNV